MSHIVFAVLNVPYRRYVVRQAPLSDRARSHTQVVNHSR